MPLHLVFPQLIIVLEKFLTVFAVQLGKHCNVVKLCGLHEVFLPLKNLAFCYLIKHLIRLKTKFLKGLQFITCCKLL